MEFSPDIREEMRMHRVILHADINNCFASIECLYDASLRGKPVAVAGDVQARHGIILAKTEQAKAMGVRTGEPIWQARQKCPELVTVLPHFDRYLRFSRMTRQIYEEYTDKVEPFGLDEAWLDVTGCEADDETGMRTAEELRRRVKFECGVTISVGAADNKIFAKLGSDMKKPDAVTVITPENFRQKVWPLPVQELLYVGRSTGRKLAGYGVRTIGELAGTDPRALKCWLGKTGEMLHVFANGGDRTPVMLSGAESEIKSIGNSTTTPCDLQNDEDVGVVFWILCESVAERMRSHGLMAQTVQISVRASDLETFERQVKLERPTVLAKDLHQAAAALFAANYSWRRPVRMVGVRACGLMPDSAAVQTMLFESEDRRIRRETLERTVDDLRRRFGHACIGRASVAMDPRFGRLNPKEDNAAHPVSFLKPGGFV